MEPEDVKELLDDELAALIAAGQKEQRERAERRRQETIALIREMAGAVGISVQIGGQRGRPAKAVSNPAKRPSTDNPAVPAVKAVKHGR